MEIASKYRVPVLPLSFRVSEVIDFPGLPLLNIEEDSIGNKYLSYLSSLKNDIEQRFLIQVSPERLGLILSGELAVKEAFNRAENKIVFMYEFTKSGIVKDNFIIPLFEFIPINNIEEDYFVTEYSSPVEAVLKATLRPETINREFKRRRRRRKS